jgi:hypothetical protein
MSRKKIRQQHKADDCEEVMPDGFLCTHWAMFKMIRIDNSYKMLCTRHANAYRAQIDAHPELFNPVRFVTVASGDLAAQSLREIPERRR